MKRISTCLAASVFAAAASSAIAGPGAIPTVHRGQPAAIRRLSVTPAAAAFGVGINLDVCGRIQTSGGLARTSIDIANNTNTATQVDAFFDGLVGGSATEIVVGVTAAGLVAQGAQQLADHSVFHSDDFIDDLRAAGLITQAEENAGVLGSLFVIFNSPSAGLFDQIGQGTVLGRFFTDHCGGTVGVSLTGHELTSSEPSSLVGVARDTTAESGVPTITTNFFINNEGFAGSGGAITVNPVRVQLTGFSNVTGNELPLHPQFDIGNFQTIPIGGVLKAVGGDPNVDDTIVVFVDIISGSSAISGDSSTNDVNSQDPSAAPLRPADWSAGR